jgi:putative molybdopterin biosynthesis protein
MATEPSADACGHLAVRPGKAADLLDVSRATIYNLMDRGELPSFTVGRSRRILLAEIEAYIGRQQARELAS